MNLRPEIAPLPELVARANNDSDAASCFFNGESFEQCDGVVIIVKGREAAFKAVTLLANAGMRTPGKPVEDKP